MMTFQRQKVGQILKEKENEKRQIKKNTNILK